MIVKFLLYTLLITLSGSQQTGENPMGIYITIKTNKRSDTCQKTLFARDKKTSACVPLNPIIVASQFAYLTEIKNDIYRDYSYFDLVLSREGFDKLKTITSALPGNDLVLVVDDTIIGFIKNKDQLFNRTISVDGTANSADVKWAHERLKKAITLKVN